MSKNKINDGQGLKSIIIPIDKGEKQIDDPDILEEYIIKRNLQHFSQAQHKLFMSDLLTTEMGLNANTTLAGKVKQGTYPHNPLKTEATNAVLQSLKKEATDPSLSTEISMIDMANSFLKWKESTSTSPSGRHLGI